MSSIAVFLVLGGASAFAASKIGTSQLKASAVTTSKIKKEAVTTAKVKKNAINGSKVKDGSLTGADINVGTLGTVPLAAKATKTDQITNIFFTANEGGSKQTILNLSGLTLQAICPGGGEVELEATTSVSHSVIDVVTAQDTDYEFNTDFNVGEVFDLDMGHSQGATEMYTAQYTRPDGVNVVIVIHDIDAFDGPAFPGTPQQSDCLVSGLAYSS
ncbi:MAG: hypothetical protein ACJ75S_09165 [Solirubrobacterales bacterium]